jgi:hypothetical protein
VIELCVLGAYTQALSVILSVNLLGQCLHRVLLLFASYFISNPNKSRTRCKHKPCL